MEQRVIWTVGHGLLPVERLIKLLISVKVEAVADVRSSPYSNRAPQFDRLALATSFKSNGISYRYFGRELGGRPAEDSYYDSSGHVLYRRLATSERFSSGMDLLMRGAGQKTTAVLCSESDPAVCHRNLLVGRVARLRGAQVLHLLHDGSVEAFDDNLVTRTGLPGMEEEDAWRSLVRVRQAPAQNIFSIE